jgi:uncharacterized glyoxalase superfamily protein PhnB
MQVNYVPEGCHSITPYLLVADAVKQVEFLKAAFGGIERAKIMGPNGRIAHAQVVVGNSTLMIGEPPPPWQPRAAMLYLYVPDVDAMYQQALKAGAKSVTPPANTFYGDRAGCVTDTSDNTWWMATHVEDVPLEELQKRALTMKRDGAKPPEAPVK